MQNQETFDQTVSGMNEYCSTDLTGKKVEPSAAQRAAGVDPGTTLPAQWWNFYINALTKKSNQFKASILSILEEMNNLGTVGGISPDPEKTNQLKTLFEEKYPSFLANFIQSATEWTGEQGRTQSVPIATTKDGKTSMMKASALPVALGGTGKTSLTPNRILQTNAAGGIDYLDFAAAGKFLMSGPNGTIILTDSMSSDEYVPQSRFIVFDFDKAKDAGSPNRKCVKIKKGVSLLLEIVNGSDTERRFFKLNETTSYDFTDVITQAGADYYIYLVPKGADEVDVVCSPNSTYPTGSYEVDGDEIPYSGSNTRKIGQFHTLCKNSGTNLLMTSSVAKGSIDNYQSSEGVYVTVKKYDDSDADGFHDFYTRRVSGKTAGYFYDVAQCEHPLNNFNAKDILPESIWCLTFKTYCDGSGMVYDVDTDLAVDIYLQSGTGQNTLSVFGGTITATRPQVCHADDMRQKRKFLLAMDEFTSAAIGSNEKTTVAGAAAPNPFTAGGHLDTASRRMVSAIGCEECCGLVWQWTRDYAGLGSATAVTAWGNAAASQANSYIDGNINAGAGRQNLDGIGAFGEMWYIVTALLVGGYWSDGSSCGSRARNGCHAVSHASGSIGGRGASRITRVAA